MLTGIHILLTYQCTLECDHCFLFSSPRAEGTMTLAHVRSILDEAQKIGTVEWIYFEGGEPLLFSLSMLEGVRLTRKMGFEVGIVTNGYWAISDEDAEVWLRPLAEMGIGDLSVSDDSFHYGEGAGSPAKRAVAAARRLGIPASSICIEKPFVEAAPGQGQEKGSPVIGGGAMFKGRAVEKLIADLPRRPWSELSTCPYEDLATPSRVHVDAYGNVHLCQGLSMGNMWKRPLSELVGEYEAAAHPVCGPLLEGGPALLAERYGADHDDEYVDECHFCYLVRRALVDRFPECLAPRQVYGLEESNTAGARTGGLA
ncbi:MAG: radical SAM protein [Thermoleophilia bacterium]|nr:radical SAM protein [Thermoleophilia bacterium]